MSVSNTLLPVKRSSAVTPLPHISVCICTYKRPDLLRRLLGELASQETAGRFTYSIVVADNDSARSAETTVTDFASASVPIRYCVEPTQGIAFARNKVVASATGDFLAFIDDDEFPARDWLLNLFNTCMARNVDGVLGPVLRHFDETPPRWLVKSNFYKRPINPTGSEVHWQGARTGNVLIKTRILTPGEPAFRTQFRSGEDQDFFRRKIEEGYAFSWCAEAVAYEVVPPSRWKRLYLLRKALLRGASASLQPSCDGWSVAKSLLAVPLYVIALPPALLLGQHRFMTLLVKTCDHLGKLLALVGINPVKGQYAIE